MTRNALVVGINNYPELENLTNPARDAEAIAQRLKEYGGFTVQRLPETILEGKLQVNSNANGCVRLEELKEAIANLFNPQGSDYPETALLFFAGHGLHESYGDVTEGFLATSDSDPSMGFLGLPLHWLRLRLQESKVKQQIVWLDCCYSGELHNFDEAYLGNLGKQGGKRRCFISACRGFEPARDSLSAVHGALTECLLEGLNPNKNGKGIVTSYDLIDFINQNFQGSPQVPICKKIGSPIILTTKKPQFINLIEDKRKLRQRTFIATSLAILAIASAVAIRMWLVANHRYKTAKSAELVSASKTSLNVDSTRSLLLAIHANLIQDTPEAKLALWNAFQENHERFHLVGHEGSILYAEFDPKDGNRVLSVSSDRTARIWKLNNSENPLVLRGHRNDVVYGKFDPQNSNRVLTVSSDGIARVWDTNNIDNPVFITEDEGFVNYGSFDPKNSNRILTASTDGTARIWDLKNSSVIVTLKGHEGDVWMAIFDPNNSNRVLTIGSDSTARVWNLNNPSNPLVLKGHQGDILYGSFDPKNPNRILTTSTDQTARVWNLNNPTQPLILNKHKGTVEIASFDPNNSNRVLTVSEDGTARVWDLSQPEKPIVLGGATGKVVYGEFKPDNSNQVLTVSQDGKAQVWELKAKGQNAIIKNTLNGHQAGVNLGIFNPHNPNQILTVGEDAVGRVWDISNQAFFELPQNQGTIIYANFSIQDSEKLLTVNRSGVIQTWDITQSKPIKKFDLQTGIDSLVYADFYPNNPSKIITINVDGIIEVWDIKNPTNSASALSRTDEKPYTLKFDTKNPDNLLIINNNGAATIRNVKRANEEQLVISVPSQMKRIAISSGEFSPNDSNKILTSSDDGVVRFWNLEDTYEPFQTISTTDRNVIWYASFDPNNSNRIFCRR